MTDYSILPAGIPPPGVTPNFVNPESRGSTAIIVNIVSMTLVVCFVMSRFYSKYYVLHKPSWDDCKPLLLADAWTPRLISSLVTCLIAMVIHPMMAM